MEHTKQNSVLFVFICAAIGFSLAAACYTWLDSRLVFLGGPGVIEGDFRKTIFLCEIFGHGVGLAIIALLIVTLDRNNALRFLICAGVPAACGAVLKLLFRRARPFEVVGEIDVEGIGIHWPFAAADEFERGLINDAIHSFPSGHAVTAFSIAMTLSMLYPRGRLVFWTLASVAALQRLFAGAHFASDIVAGATVGFVLSNLLWRKLERAATQRSDQ